jgi:hypothetical protein
MLDIFFSLQFIWISCLIVALSIAIGFFCAYLHSHLLQVTAGEWLVEHIYCPITKTLILMCMTLLLFPLIVEGANYQQVMGLFVERQYLTNMMNILMVSGLIFSFFPLLSHPALAMPVLGCIATAILLNSYFALTAEQVVNFIPDLHTLMKILALIIATYWANRWIIDKVSSYIDDRYIVTGSKTMVSDVSYLILQIPVMLAYAQSLINEYESMITGL